MRAIRCLSTPPAQIVKYSLITLWVSRSRSRSKYVSVSVRVFRAEDLDNILSSSTIILVKILNYFDLANHSNLATASWNSELGWKYSLLVDERVLDANLSLSANRDAWWWYVFDQCSLSAEVAMRSLSGLSATPSHFFYFRFGCIL